MNNFIKKAAETVDRIFYVVYPENRQLKSGAETEILQSFVDILGVQLYAITSGPNVQNSKELLNELKLINNIEKFEIICVIESKDEIAMLSHWQKIEFVEKLKTYNKNSGEIAEMIIDGTES